MKAKRSSIEEEEDQEPIKLLRDIKNEKQEVYKAFERRNEYAFKKSKNVWPTP